VQPSQQDLAAGERRQAAGMCGGEGERERLRVGVWGAGATPDRDDPGVERCSVLPPIAAGGGDSPARIAAAASAAETGAAGTGPAVPVTGCRHNRTSAHSCCADTGAGTGAAGAGAGAGIAGIAEPPVAEVRCAEVLPLNPWAAAGAAGCVWRVSSMLLRLSECNALQQLRVGEPGLGSYWRKVLSSTVNFLLLPKVGFFAGTG
jgi:hypothetical protein